MWKGDGQEHTAQSSEGVSTAACCIYGKWNLPKLEGGIVVLVEGMYGPVVVLVGVRGKASRDLIVVARSAETHCCV
jgi:hypothetical protein